MFFHLLFIHLFRPFLKYRQGVSPLPSHVSPRKLCSQAAAGISKLFRLYKRTYGLQQICNIAVYICHSACTIHLLNLPDKNASRDFVHGVKHLEEIAECWLGARRTLAMLHTVAKKWNIDLSYEAETVLSRTDEKYGQLFLHQRRSSKVESPLAGLAQPTNPTALPNSHTTQVGRNSALTATTPASLAASEPPSLAPPDSSAIGVQDSLGQENLAQELLTQQIQFDLRPEQLQSWNRNQAIRNPTSQNPTSPHVLFGGVDALVRDSQNFWFKEEHTLFDHWNAHQATVYENTNGVNGGDFYTNQDTFIANEVYGVNNRNNYGSQGTIM